MLELLIVEDDRLEGNALEHIISQQLGDQVRLHLATSGHAALELLKEYPIKIALVDLSLPDISGIELIRQIKQRSRDIYVVIMTASDEAQFAEEVGHIGVAKFLMKPVRPRVIVELISERLGSLHQHEEADAQIDLTGLEDAIRANSYRAARNEVKRLVCAQFEKGTAQRARIQMVQRVLELMENHIEALQPDGVHRQRRGNMEKVAASYARMEKYALYSLLSDELVALFDERNYNSTAQREMDMQQILNHIDCNIKKGITLESVSEFANMSIYYMSKRFKKEQGTTFIAYVTEERIARAKELLEDTDEPIVNIAIELSYNDANYFSKAFKTNVGMTPSLYREQFAQQKSTGDTSAERMLS